MRIDGRGEGVRMGAFSYLAFVGIVPASVCIGGVVLLQGMANRWVFVRK